MTMPRVLRISFAWLLACAALLSAPIVQAQAYPNKPIKIIVPYPPGGTSDILARAIGQKLTDSLGQTIVVENKPGANGNLGADFVSKSAPDGYTLLLADIGALAISPSLYKLSVRPDHRFLSGDNGGVLAAHPCCPSFSAGEQCKRIGHARQIEARQVEFCGVQRWQRAASGRHRIRIACGCRLGLHSRTRVAPRRLPTWPVARRM